MLIKIVTSAVLVLLPDEQHVFEQLHHIETTMLMDVDRWGMNVM